MTTESEAMTPEYASEPSTGGTIQDSIPAVLSGAGQFSPESRGEAVPPILAELLSGMSIWQRVEDQSLDAVAVGTATMTVAAPETADETEAAVVTEAPALTDADTEAPAKVPAAEQQVVPTPAPISPTAMFDSMPPLPKLASPRVIAVANQKGGVGKTTSTVNLAAALAVRGAAVLVIDLDPQGNASTALGIDHSVEVPSVYDVLIGGKPIVDVVHNAPDFSELTVVPATIDLAGSEIELVSLVARETRLEKAIQQYFRDQTEAGRRIPDYVFIDCPPSLGLLTVNALVAAREVLIPIQCEYYALEGLGQLLRNVEMIRSHLNPDLEVSAILLTMYDARTKLASQVAEEVRSHFEAIVLPTSIPRSVRISEAPSHGQTVLTYDPASSGAWCYLQAAEEFAVRGLAAHKEES